MNQLKEVLDYLRNYSLAAFQLSAKGYFSLGLILTFCGCRVSEAVTIKLENLDIEERYFKSGTENSHRKSGEVYFCFPKIVATHLSEYVEDLKARMSPGNVWLFPGNHNGHLGVCTVCSRFGLSGLPFKVKSYTFRHTLETFQLNIVNAFPLEHVEILSNHAPKGTVMKNYNIVSIEERRAMADKYIPKEYKKLTEWLETV